MPNRRSPAVKATRKKPGESIALPSPNSGAGEGLTVVGIGASAGGLEAGRKLLAALPAASGMAFIFVQHLDPTHESLLATLLASYTTMPVQEARDGMIVKPNHLYVIPPGAYLSVRHGGLHVSHPVERHGARLPFDFLLRSIADACGARGVGIILSGTGSDGCLGLKALKSQGGLVIAQDPDEASFDGMPRSAIHTGLVDFVLPVAKIPGALSRYSKTLQNSNENRMDDRADTMDDWLVAIIDLLRTKATRDFSQYRPGTLRRRIERRMALRDIGPSGWGQYLQLLRDDPAEQDCLADNLLINVTSFFRDMEVFSLLAKKIIPDLIGRPVDAPPVRIWVAGCSTGQEAYSLAIIFHEAFEAAGALIKLEIFASDADSDAIASAREGVYSAAIEAEVSPARLARFFMKEGQHYRVSAALRAAVVFTVHNILSDPPFSRINLVSCRNLLIYLDTRAQAQAISVFHFSLLEGGTLVLGSAESIPGDDVRFQTVAQAERIYRHVGQIPRNILEFAPYRGEVEHAPIRLGQARAPRRHSALAELCRQLVLESFAPAAVLINRKNECLYTLGATDRYLSVSPGHPSIDLLVMAREGVRASLRTAIQRAGRENARVVVPGGRADAIYRAGPFNIDVQPVMNEGEAFFIVCFVDNPAQALKKISATLPEEASQIGALEQDLEATRKDLQAATRDLEISNEEQRAVNEEASSVNEEYQSANEELLTSKEELQSLNEELVTLNHQLQETLGRERTILDDLQNVMGSTDVATLFLDTDLNIRLFTPATKLLFNVLPNDVGRPLADLRSLTGNSYLEEDARQVLRTTEPMEREIQTEAGESFRRRMLPYRSREHAVEGVVITFMNVTAQRHAANALEVAKQEADQANVVKSRFLAMASHDLRQPLQTLTLLQGLLTKAATGERAQKLVERLEEALDAMSGILNTLLDINRIEAGTVNAETEDLSVNDLLQRLNNEFVYHAQAKGIALRKVGCGAVVHSDLRLLEQILRNFLSNALKYTNRGRVLLGCRRHGDSLSIEVWDTGVGIPESEQQAIFEEYHQLDNPARERSRGLGLGLSIVRQLGRLLGHRISVRSRPGKGSVFAIEVALAGADRTIAPTIQTVASDHAVVAIAPKGATFLVIDDDPGVRELLVLLLEDEGYHTIAAEDGVSAVEMVARQGIQPDLILADFNLPNGMNGLQAMTRIRDLLHRQIPAIILTGDISTGLLRDIAQHDAVHLNKPVKSGELTAVIRRLLPDEEVAIIEIGAEPGPVAATGDQTIFIVDDDAHVRDNLREMLEAAGRTVATFPSSEAFLAAYRPGDTGCLLVDANLPGMDGLSLLRELHTAGRSLPSIMITGFGDIRMAVEAMKAGAIDFIEKPVGIPELVISIERALASARDASKLTAWHDAAAAHVASLTPRQREIMERVLAGHPSKNIAADLGISQRTVENHRAAIMKKTSTKSLPALARLALAANGDATAVVR